MYNTRLNRSEERLESKHRPATVTAKRGLRAIGFSFAAILLIFFGFLLATNLDLSAPSIARPGTSGTVPAFAAAYPVVERDGREESPFVAVVEATQDAVVNISSRSRNEDLPWWYHGSNFSSSSGSGFFFREDGYILTNNHVVDNSVDITVRTASGYAYEAKLVGADPLTDLAVLKVEPEEDITVIGLGDSEELRVGDWAVAIGNPFPQHGLERTVTVGVISAKGRSNLRFGGETPLYQNYIQTDASINPGNSGGPLLDLRGQCIGVNAAISSPTGTSVGIGFAIPINMAKAIIPDLIESGTVHRGWLGVWLSNVTEREAKHQRLGAVRGVRIDSVFAHSPAEQGGIRQGDIITIFNEHEVQNSNQFAVLVSTVPSGTYVPITVVRSGDELQLFTTVADRDAFLASINTGGTVNPPPGRGTKSWMGMELATFTPELARDMGIEHVEAVYVIRVFPNSPADRASIAPGTIVLNAKNESVKSVEDITRVAAQIGNSDRRVPLIVQEPDGSIARKVLRP